jgi:hypothetical protein
MAILQRVVLTVVLATSVHVAESQSSDPDQWSRILSLMEEGTAQGNPQLAEYLKTLTAEQMLLAARQACEDVAHRSGEIHDMPPSEVAKIYVMTCLSHYFDRIDTDEGAKTLLGIITDVRESPFLRRALISRMWSRKQPFDVKFLAYLSVNETVVTSILTEMLENPEEDSLVRKEAMECLEVQLSRQMSDIARADPNVHAVWERTHEAVQFGKALRTGQITLTEDTWKKLKPVEATLLANAKLLGAILADKENEPKNLRKHARQRLEAYRRLPLTEDGYGQIEEALRESHD